MTENTTTFDARQSRIPWPDSVGPHLIDKFKELSQEGKPPYWAIGKIIGEGSTGLSNLMLSREDQEREKTGKIDRNSEESQTLWYPIEGYEELEAITNWAMMLEETNGDVEKHPDYIAAFAEPILGVSIVGGDITREAEQYLRNQRILQAARKDPLGRGLLKIKEGEMKSYLRKGVNSQLLGRVIGFRRAAKRYNQILDYFIEQKVIEG